MPLLIAEREDVRLYDGRGDLVPVQQVQPPELSGALGGNDQPLFFFRPAEPLAPGDYGFERFSFSATSTDSEIPSAGTVGDAELFIDDNPDDSTFLGCGGGISSCGDTTMLIVNLPEASRGREPAPNYLVTFTTDDGRSVSRLVSDEFGYTEAELKLRFYGGADGFGHFSEVERVCVSVRGVSFEGALGAPLEVGCALNEGADSGGCSTTQSRGDSGFFVLVLLMALTRRSRRRRTNPAR